MSKELTTKSPYTEQQLELIKSTVAKGATNDELKLFLYTASRTGLDPLTKQIHFVKRGGQMTIQTGIDGYRAIAERKGDLAGIDDAVYDSEDKQHPNKASVTVYRMVNGDRVPFTASARWSEYAPTGAQAFMWTKMPYLMLAKCAEALALRKAFPNDLSGLYTNEEMQQADRGIPKNYEHSCTPADESINNDFLIGATSDDEFTEADVEIIDENVNTKQKYCEYCGKWHNGKYSKCIDCWKKEKDTGVKLEKLQQQKTIINSEAEPF